MITYDKFLDFINKDDSVDEIEFKRYFTAGNLCLVIADMVKREYEDYEHDKETMSKIRKHIIELQLILSGSSYK